MKNSTRILVIICMKLSFVPISLGIQGTASFYNPPYTPSACYGNEDNGVMVAAASKALWRNRSICGASYMVYCTGATNLEPQPCKIPVVFVSIVDYCPKCRATINLSRDAFGLIANLNAGRIHINYTIIPWWRHQAENRRNNLHGVLPDGSRKSNLKGEQRMDSLSTNFFPAKFKAPFASIRPKLKKP